MNHSFYILLFLVLLSARVVAQQDSLSVTKGISSQLAKVDSFKLPTLQNKKIDTLKAKYSKRKEALQKKQAKAKAKLDKFNPNNGINKVNHKLDSLNPSNRVATKVKQKLDSLSESKSIDKLNQKLDSLTDSKKVDNIKSRLDSAQTKISRKIDSLLNIPMPDSLIKRKIGKLQSGLDSLQNSKAVKSISKAQQKVDKAQEKVAGSLKNAEEKINTKFSGFNENGGKLDKLNLSGVAGKAGIDDPMSALSDKLPSSVGNVQIKQLKVPSLGNTKLTLPEANTKINVGSLNKGLPSVKSPAIGNLKLDKNIPGAENLSKATGDLNELGGLTKQVDVYQKDIKQVATGDFANAEQLPKALETKLEGMKEVKGVTGEAGEYTDMIKKWESDPEVMKEMALNKAKEQAVNHFAGHEKELLAAVNQLSNMKSKYKDAETVIDLLKKPANPLKKKPFVERLILGMGLQMQVSNRNHWFDFNPYVGYRFARRFSAGLGWLERLSEDFNSWKFVAREHAYGPRMFTEFKLKENFHVRAEAEYINALVTSPYVTVTSADGRASVFNYFLGIKKSFRFSRQIDGNVQLMYNLYNPLKRSPYVSDLIVRMGFEFPRMKKRGNGLVK